MSPCIYQRYFVLVLIINKILCLKMFNSIKNQTLSRPAVPSFKKAAQPVPAPAEPVEASERKANVGASEKNRRLRMRFLRDQNQNKWQELHIIGNYFMIFLQQVKNKIPSAARAIDDILMKQEEEILSFVKQKLNILSSTVNNILSEFEKEKERELASLQKMKTELSDFLSSKKQEFKETSLNLAEETIISSTQPLQNEIQRLKNQRVSIKQLRLRNTFTPCVMVIQKQKEVSSVNVKKEEEEKPKKQRRRRQSQDLQMNDDDII